jgi:tape measure domain-containing protein
MADQTLNVKITADASGFDKATTQAANDLIDLQKATKALDSETVDVTVDTNVTDAQRDLTTLSSSVQDLQGEKIDVPANVELGRINRDLGNLNKVLDGIEKRKADPHVGLDIVQLNKDEAKVKKAIADLDARKITIEADVVAVGGGRIESLAGSLQSLDDKSGGMLPGLGLATTGLSKFGGAASAASGPLVVLTAAVGGWKKAWDLAGMAGDIETITVQLDALTKGHGVETLQGLQAQAAATPFELTDLATATEQLLASGVALQDIPGYIQDIGNVASVANVPIGQIATVFAQMESNGKAQFEDLKQLADAGIPVWQTLADATGKTVPELQRLATEGKLGADAITLLHQSLNNLYPTAMLDQSHTLNGELSTLKDNVTQVGQGLGTLFLPTMKDATDGLIYFTGKVLEGVTALAEFNEFIKGKNTFGLDLFGLVNPIAGGIELIHHFTSGTDDAGDSMKGLKDNTDEALAAVMQGLNDSATAAADFEKAVKAAEDNVRQTIEDFGNIGMNVRTKVSFLVDSADLEDEIHKAIAGTPGTDTEQGVPSVTLPAHLKISQVSGLSDPQQQLLGNLSSFVETQLQEGARRAELNPNFDEDAWFRQVRRKTKGLLIDAGIDPDNAERVLTRIFGLPRKVPVNADISGAQKDLDALTPKPVKLPLVLSPQRLDTTDPLMATFTGGGTLAAGHRPGGAQGARPGRLQREQHPERDRGPGCSPDRAHHPGGRATLGGCGPARPGRPGPRPDDDDLRAHRHPRPGRGRGGTRSRHRHPEQLRGTQRPAGPGPGAGGQHEHGRALLPAGLGCRERPGGCRPPGPGHRAARTPPDSGAGAAGRCRDRGPPQRQGRADGRDRLHSEDSLMALNITIEKEDLETLFVRVHLSGMTPGVRYDVMRLQLRYLGKDDAGTRLYERELPDRRALWSSVAHRVGWEAPAAGADFRDFECPKRPTKYFVVRSDQVGPHEWDFGDGRYPVGRGVLDNQVVHFNQDIRDLHLNADPDDGHVLVRSVHELAHYAECCVVELDGPRYTARVNEIAVMGTEYPVMISDTREARRGTVTLLVHNLGQYNALRRVVFPASGRIRPFIMNSGGDAALLLDDMRCIPLDVEIEQATPADGDTRYVHIDYVEIDPSAPLIRRIGDNDALTNPPNANFSISDTSPARNQWITLTDTSTGQGDDWEWTIERGRETDNKVGKWYTDGPHKVRWALRGQKTVKLRFGGSGEGYHTRTKIITVH